MPLGNLAHGSGASEMPQSAWMKEWDIFQVPGSGAELKFSGLYPVVSDKWFSSGTTITTRVATTALNEFVAFELSLVREVEYVFTAFRNGVFYVWIVVEDFRDEVRRRIYDRERAIIDEFATFEFDFYILSKMGRDPCELISEWVTLAYEKGP